MIQDMQESSQKYMFMKMTNEICFERRGDGYFSCTIIN